MTSAAPGPQVLFVAAHPDDEAIAMGVAIAEHVAAGLDVHVLLATDGTSTSVLPMLNGTGTNSWWATAHNPAAEGYAPLTVQDIGLARLRETAAAADALATGLAGTLTLHRAGLLDGAVQAGDIQAAIVSLADQLVPGTPVRLKGHTWMEQLEASPDHLAVGAAIKNLAAADPVRFGGPRYYLMPGYWNDPDLSLVAEFWDTPTDGGIRARAVNACRAYGAWQPQSGAFAVGMHSRPDWLASVMANPRCLVHS